jgi:hypothetical protein
MTAALTCALAATTLLGGCFDDDRKRDGTASSPPVPSEPSTPRNRAPTISGTPSGSAKVGQLYVFRPTASDPDGDTLSFAVANKPAWATFDAKTGRLSGTPANSAVGTFADIRVTATDGRLTSSPVRFSIDVTGTTLGSATLRWQPPTQNQDGTPLTNLAGYVVRYGTSSSRLDSEVEIKNPGVTSAVIEDLTPATWYFAMSAFNLDGIESSLSSIASKTIR